MQDSFPAARGAPRASAGRLSTPSDGPSARGRRGGIVLRVDGALSFLAAADAVRISSPPRITPVPGAPPALLGVTLYEGTIVPVLSIGSARGEMIVCQHAGEVVGLVGGEIVKTGTFEVADDGVAVGDERATPLDLTALYARVQASARSRGVSLRE